MRDYRDAKTMAQSLRETLTAKFITISHSESLELVSKMLGVPDWNTLSAMLQAEHREAEPVVTPNPRYPAIPIRDFVPFPMSSFPLFVAREKTKQALDRAFARHREIVLATQKDAAIEEPGFEDVYEIGLLATLLELERLTGGTMKILVHAHRRVQIRRFAGEAGAFEADIADIAEGPIPDAPELTRETVAHFETYAASHKINLPQTWPVLAQIRDPGRVADVIAQHLPLPIGDKQGLLGMLDPVARLQNVAALLAG